MKKIAYFILSIIMVLSFSIKAQAATPSEDGVGLAESPYSISSVYDKLPSAKEYPRLNYTEWQPEGTFKDLYQNGYYIIRIQDQLENVTYVPMKIDGLSEKFAVQYIDMDDEGIILGSTMRFVKYGTVAFGADIGTDTEMGAYYRGYIYDNCTSTTVSPFEENVVTRTFKSKIYTITYHSEDGNAFKSEKVRYGRGLALDDYPEKESIVEMAQTTEYQFRGWVTKDGKAVNTGSITSDLDLYPVYEEVVIPAIITIGFHYNDAADTVEYITGPRGEIIPPEPTKEDIQTEEGLTWYTFSFWTTANGTKVFDLGSLINNIDLYANYTEEFSPTYEAPVLEEASLEEKEVEEIEVKREKGNDEVRNFLERLKSITEINEEPVAKSLDGIVNTIADNKELIETAATVGILAIVLWGILYATMGFGIIQTIIFVYALIKKHKRYTKGVWFIDREDMKYVDKYGREVKVTKDSKGVHFQNKRGKKLYGVNVNTELKRLNSCRITKQEFNRRIKESDVYTVFNKDVRLEVNNIQSTRTIGFNLLSGIKNISSAAGQYTMKVVNGSKELIYEFTTDTNTLA